MRTRPAAARALTSIVPAAVLERVRDEVADRLRQPHPVGADDDAGATAPIRRARSRTPARSPPVAAW